MFKKIYLLIIFLIFPIKAYALIEVDITRGNLNPLPLAVSPLSIDDKSRKTSLNISVFCIQNLLRLLHPYSPFITEELWAHFKGNKLSDLIISKWPSKKPNLRNIKVEKDMSIVKEIITALRSIRSRMNLSLIHI